MARIARMARTRLWLGLPAVVGFSYLMATHNALLEYLTTTKIGEKGQLTVPKQFREDLGLRSGAPVAVLGLGDGLILLPEEQRFEQLCERVSSRLAGAGLTPEDVLATLAEARHNVYARHYEKKRSQRLSRRRSRTRPKE
jgi:AbrB family looped-hinge helix DNA binding protein